MPDHRDRPLVFLLGLTVVFEGMLTDFSYGIKARKASTVFNLHLIDFTNPLDDYMTQFVVFSEYYDL